MHQWDVIVIGGGHAGAEACAMSARLGLNTLLLTQNLETIGQMSCNPAIGGIAKGTVVREVDALGGVMGRATDRARIQFRMLNRSKGPAVWSPRAQCDRALYRRAVRSELERFSKLRFAQGTVARFQFEGQRVSGVETTDGRRYRCRAVVLTAGTFIRGEIRVGTKTRIPAGRAGESPSVDISQAIADIGVTIERFKTGTPPRIDGRTVDFDGLARQDGDDRTFWFSFHARHSHPAQTPCYLTHTTDRLREVVAGHLGESAMYGGAISGRGPRYCPSIEDKIVRFPNAERHQVFLEPEGLDTSEMYVNGLSTSLPPEVQLEFLRTVPGLEKVEMTRPGYAIEYDYFPPTQLDRSLAVKGFEGLYFAGQINGTTGYEEAAGQGIVAGLSAGLMVRGEPPMSFGRDVAYIGVMVDDLVGRGVDEPYRLFTSRAEFRLLLRQDNALRRLLPMAQQYGLLSDQELRAAEARIGREHDVLETARSVAISPEAAGSVAGLSGEKGIRSATRIAELASRPGVDLVSLMISAGLEVDEDSAEWAAIELRYRGYMEREREVAARLSRLDEFAIPEDLAYETAETISFEAREKLARRRPRSLGEAARIPGVRPADLQNLVVEVIKRRS